MTPKEKAETLVNEFMNLKHVKLSDYSRIEWPTAKKCALIAVDEMLNELDHIPFDDYDYGTSKMKYWNNVKEEIENL